MPGMRPVVNPIDNVVMLNNSIAISEFFTVSDPDGDPIAQYTFTDGGNASSGVFVFQGVVQANGITLTIAASDLDDLDYLGGPVVNNENIRIEASDGTLTSDPVFATVYTARSESVRPLVQIDAISVLGNESVAASSFISAFDPDGFPILSYNIRDRVVDRSFFSLDGEAVPQGEFNIFSAAEFSRLQYNAVGRRSENIDVFAFDGTINSLFTTEVIQVDANLNRPVVSFASGVSVQDELLPLADFVSFFDADGNTLEYIEFRDRNARSFSGSIVFQGQELAPLEFHRFTPDQVDQVFFQGGERNITEQLRYRVSDGRFRSATETISLTNVAGGGGGEAGAPELVADNLLNNALEQLENVSINSLISQTNEGFPAVSYEVIDANVDSNSASLFINDTVQAGGELRTFTDDQYENQLEIRTGTFQNRSFDEFYVRASNGNFNGNWTRLNLYTEPEFIGAFDIVDNFANPAFQLTNNGVTELTFSFMQQIPDYERGLADDNPGRMPNPRFFLQFTEAQQQATRTALSQIEQFANVRFTEVADSPPTTDPVSGNRGGTLRFGNYYRALAEQFGGAPGADDHPPFCSSTVAPSFLPESGDIYFNVDLSPIGLPISSCEPLDFFFSPNVGPGTAEYEALLDVLAFSLGQGDPSDIFGPPDPQFPILPASTDTDSFTVQFNGVDDGSFLTGFQLYDVNFFQQAYGANTTFNTGDNVYSINTLTLGALTRETIYDAGGTDTLSAVGSTNGGAIVDLRPGRFSAIGSIAANPLFGFEGNISIAFGVDIENAIGSNNDDQIFGNELANRIIGGNGNDIIRGNGGDDFITGGAGADTFQFTIADGDNRINEQQLAGRDTLEFVDIPGLESFELTDDFSFRLEGRDLVVSLTLDGNPQADTTVTIEDQTRGSFQIESLSIGTTTIDLVNLTDQADSTNQRFQLTPASSIFGNLVTPV